MLQMQGTVREVALDVVRADGSRLPVLVNAVLESAPGGAPRLIRVAVFDATHRREYERELLRAKQRAERSEAHAQELARTLQATLIPPSPPNLPGLDVSASYRPAGDGEEVGGDFYDVFQIGPGDWVVALGDVCGKGVEAAVLTALVRHTVRALTVQEQAPSVVLAALNQVLIKNGSDRFCTVVLVRLRRDDRGWVATISAAGHPLPLLVGRDGQVREVGAPAGADVRHRAPPRALRRAGDVHRRCHRGPPRPRVLRRAAAARRRRPASHRAPPRRGHRRRRAGVPARHRP